MKTPIVHAAIYVRFSPRPVKYDEAGNEIQCDSNDNQLADCRAYCLASGYRVELEETDPFTSGGVLGEVERPGLFRALRSLKRDWVLICFSPDRLAKGVLIEELIYQALEESRARVEFVEGDGLPNTLEGQFARRVRAAANEYQRLAGNQRTSWAARHHQANGRRMCGTKHLPYGMQLDFNGPRIVGMRGVARPSHMIPNPAEQEIIARILAWAAEGKRPPTIKKLLEAERIPCRGSLTWNRKLLGRIITRGGTA